MSQSLSPARISLRPTTARLGRGGLVVAVLLHAAVVAATLFSWQHKLDITDESPPVVPVDLVTLADKTNIMPTVQKQPKAPPKEEVKPPEQTPPPPPTPPPTPKAENATEPEPAPKPQQAFAVPAPKPLRGMPTPVKPYTQKMPNADVFSALLI